MVYSHLPQGSLGYIILCKFSSISLWVGFGEFTLQSPLQSKHKWFSFCQFLNILEFSTAVQTVKKEPSSRGGITYLHLYLEQRDTQSCNKYLGHPVCHEKLKKTSSEIMEQYVIMHIKRFQILTLHSLQFGYSLSETREKHKASAFEERIRSTFSHTDRDKKQHQLRLLYCAPFNCLNPIEMNGIELLHLCYGLILKRVTYWQRLVW